MFACMCGRVTFPFPNNQGGKALLVLYTNSVTTSKSRKKEGKEGRREGGSSPPGAFSCDGHSKCDGTRLEAGRLLVTALNGAPGRYRGN